MIRLRPEDVILAIGAGYQIARRIAGFTLDYDHTFLLASAVNAINKGWFGVMQATASDLSMVVEYPPVY